MRHAVFSILVENSAGVLSRVAGLFSRRGYNIDSLTVGETTDPKVSRMTVTVTGDDDVLEQIEKQLSKLIDVKEVVELEPVPRIRHTKPQAFPAARRMVRGNVRPDKLAL